MINYTDLIELMERHDPDARDVCSCCKRRKTGSYAVCKPCYGQKREARAEDSKKRRAKKVRGLRRWRDLKSKGKLIL